MQHWIDNAPCVGLADIFFPEIENERSVAAAKKICSNCPSRLPCLDSSLYEDYGVWGGMAVWDRRKFRYNLIRSFVNIMPDITLAIESVATTLNESMDCILW